MRYLIYFIRYLINIIFPYTFGTLSNVFWIPSTTKSFSLFIIPIVHAASFASIVRVLHHGIGREQ